MEAKLIQVRLVITTASMIGSKKKGFEITNCDMNPLEVSGFICRCVDSDIFQTGIAFESVTFNCGTGLHIAVVYSLQRSSRDVRYKLKPRTSGQPFSVFETATAICLRAEPHPRFSHACELPDRLRPSK